MIRHSFKNHILFAHLAVIIVTAVATAMLGFSVIKDDIVARAQRAVDRNSSAARIIYNSEIEKISTAFNLAPMNADLQILKSITGLDYVYLIDAKDATTVKSPIVLAALAGKNAAGTRIINKPELEEISPELLSRSSLNIKSTTKARPSNQKILESAMVIECARLIPGDNATKKILYGGKLLNRDFALVDKIRDIIFENKFYNARPMGTVTIFQGDVRIATNVLDATGERAVGTRVSDEVYRKVIEEGNPWFDRAFVVTDWYLTAYEPLRDINNKIIGILYVGLLEQPFLDLQRNLLLAFLLIISGVSVLAILFSLFMSSKVSHPVTEMVKAAEKISGGQFDHHLPNNVSVKEISHLIAAFNSMSDEIQKREQNLRVAHNEMGALNKSYLDMIGFVSHELKGLLGTVIMNVYSVKDGYMGELNEKQKNAMDSAAASLEHFENVVRNYLDLSRIEKGELKITRSPVRLKEDIIDSTMRHFEKERQAKNMRINNLVPNGINLSVDKSLISIVCNNLVGNAIKYGKTGGTIAINADTLADKIKISFYNDGEPITAEHKDLLFKKFSRLPGSQRIKGTGLGLFIIKEIIQKHNGHIWVEPRAEGNEFIFTLSRNQ